ncbi:uncharacterized protein KGF55_000725 [Candida pseudojiufengensis]|uniref:uncharacterized protein n=1 Tax=Candida pseudojiufengensis TaxID=497109 RepID=UPI0022258D1D|nr:uncharacterized protein KGF55_000725 [Candida pseudojiufengensis]KAI5966416.1 hypothetical protein KGF55_000725 [Candida pseudojiufengensis]
MTYIAEYLPRLGHLSIEITSISQENLSTIEVQGNENIILVLNHSPSIKIKSPIPVTHISLIGVKSEETKLKLTLKVHADQNPGSSEEVEPKWSCKWLRTHTTKHHSSNVFKFICSNCSYEIINSLSYQFKDMPNEFWYEMMDYWHCHKPEDNHPTDKDYGILVPKDSKDIFIGSYYLLLCKSDNVIAKDKLYHCKGCNNVVGEKYQNVIKLLKWKIDLEYTNEDQKVISKYDPTLFVADFFNTQLRSSASRRFKIKSNKKWIYLWIMNTGIDVTLNDQILNNCLKILYTEIINSKDEGKYEEIESQYEEVRESFLKTLQQNTIPSKTLIGSLEYSISFIPTS